jgi:hypothetical protein
MPAPAQRRLADRLDQYGLRLPATGVDVLAVLVHHAKGQLPATHTVTTPSGGRHLYFTAPPGLVLGNSARSLGPLIDTRAVGGQVVAPPTATPDGTYRVADPAEVAELPPWLATALTASPTPPVAHRYAPAREAAGGYVRAAVAAEVARVTCTVEEGARNHALLVAAIALGQLVAGGALAEDDVRDALTVAAAGHIAAGAYSPHQAQLTITSGLRRGAARPRRPPELTRRTS